MRVVYIGNFEPEYSTENDVRKAFEYLGHEVIKVQENRTNHNEIMNALNGAELLLITGTWDDAIPLNDWLNIIHECAVRGIPTATLHLDTFWGTSRGGRKWWLAPMFHTAYIFTADGDYQEQWELLGKKHIWLPPAVRFDAAHFGNFRQEYACDVAFVGSNGVGYHEDVWNYRKELVDNLREMCKKNGWSFRNPGGDEPKIDRGGDMNDFYASAKVTVGDSLCLSKDKSHYWSDRVPEALGRGGRLIMPQIDAVSEMYNHQVPMYEWGNFEHLERIIETYLVNINEPELKKEVEYTQKETAKNHTYVNRVQTIIKAVS